MRSRYDHGVGGTGKMFRYFRNLFLAIIGREYDESEEHRTVFESLPRTIKLEFPGDP